MSQINYKQFIKEASDRTAVLSRYREEHEEFPLTEYFSFQKSVLNSSRFGAYPMDIFNAVFSNILDFVTTEPPVAELTDFFSQFLNGNRKRYHHKAAPELIAKQKSCTFMFKFDEFLVFEDQFAADKFIMTLLARFQINNADLSSIVSKFLLCLEAPASAVIDNKPFSCVNAISSFELITILFDTITLFKNVLKYNKFDNHADAGAELNVRFVHKELALEARKEGSGCRVYRCCKHFKQEWYLEKTKCSCEPLTKRKKSGKLTTPSPKRCKNSNDSSKLKVDEDDTETFLLHSSLVTTVHSSPSSPSSDTLPPLNGTRIETDDIEETIFIDSEGEETEEEDVEEVKGGDEQINVGMFENITDLVVESVRKRCSGDEVMSTKIKKIRDALKNERHEHMLLVERYERDLKTSADDLRAVKSENTLLKVENETVTSKLESTNGRLLVRSKETFKLLNYLRQLRSDNSELERLNNEMKLNLSNMNSTMQNVTDRELALNERLL